MVREFRIFKNFPLFSGETIIFTECQGILNFSRNEQSEEQICKKNKQYAVIQIKMLEKQKLKITEKY